MKKLMSANYSPWAFNIALLLLRLGVGVLMIYGHGYDKLVHFGVKKDSFPGNFLGLGSSFSLALDIFAEFFCSMFLIIGLFTRLAVVPLIIAMLVAVMTVHGGHFLGAGEPATHYLICYIVLLLVGPGRVSVDSMIGK